MSATLVFKNWNSGGLKPKKKEELQKSITELRKQGISYMFVDSDGYVRFYVGVLTQREAIKRVKKEFTKYFPTLEAI